MEIVGNKVFIRAIEYRDLDFLKDLINSPEIESQTIDFHYPLSEKSQKEWYENLNDSNALRCIIENKMEKQPIGYVSVTDIDQLNQNATVGIKMDTFSKYRSPGDMDEIFYIMEYFCFFEMNLYRLQAEVLADNLLSISNLKRHGYKQDGILRKKCFKHGERKDVLIFSLLRDEFNSQVRI